MPESAALYSVADAQQKLGIGRSQLYELLGDGRLRSVTLGRRRLIPEAAISDFIAALEAAAAR